MQQTNFKKLSLLGGWLLARVVPNKIIGNPRSAISVDVVATTMFMIHEDHYIFFTFMCRACSPPPRYLVPVLLLFGESKITVTIPALFDCHRTLCCTGWAPLQCTKNKMSIDASVQNPVFFFF